MQMSMSPTYTVCPKAAGREFQPLESGFSVSKLLKNRYKKLKRIISLQAFSPLSYNMQNSDVSDFHLDHDLSFANTVDLLPSSDMIIPSSELRELDHNITRELDHLELAELDMEKE